MINKSKLAILLGALMIPGFSYAASEDDPSCDEACQKSIDFRQKMDIKDREIERIKKEIELKKAMGDLHAIESGGGNESEADKEKLQELKDQVMTLSSEVDELRLKQSSPSTSNLMKVDRKGLDKIFVTSTKSVAGSWKATVFYDNTQEELMVGDIIDTGMRISSISRRGIEVELNNNHHLVRITSEKLAKLRAFDDVEEESMVRREQLKNIGIGSSGTAGPSGNGALLGGEDIF